MLTLSPGITDLPLQPILEHDMNAGPKNSQLDSYMVMGNNYCLACYLSVHSYMTSL